MVSLLYPLLLSTLLHSTAPLEIRHKRRIKDQLIAELADMRQRVLELAASEAERQRADAKLRESESRLSDIMSSINDIVFAFDSESRFIYYNSPRSEDLYAQPDEFMGKKPSEILPPRIYMQFAEAFEKNRKGEVAGYEYRLEMSDETRWFSTKLAPSFLDGEFAGAVSVVSLPDTFCQARHLEGHRDADMFIQEMTEQIQAELEETQVATISAVNNFDPIVSLGNHAQLEEAGLTPAADDPLLGGSSLDEV